MNNIKKLTGLELSELLALTSEIDELINHRFCHVNEHIPAALACALNKYRSELISEHDRRGDLF